MNCSNLLVIRAVLWLLKKKKKSNFLMNLHFNLAQNALLPSPCTAHQRVRRHTAILLILFKKGRQELLITVVSLSDQWWRQHNNTVQCSLEVSLQIELGWKWVSRKPAAATAPKLGAGIWIQLARAGLKCNLHISIFWVWPHLRGRGKIQILTATVQVVFWIWDWA